ncbi:hypothetical protein [Prevotella sp. 885]|uniref:hypothetical protein n=1 Tax=Prevotella sp. 885 TaxID=2022527 RepID=UPI001140B3AF|nr:hypothetical protein [Prevotella sp. 885]
MTKELAENIISQIKEDKAQQATITLKSGKEMEFNPTDDDCRLMQQPDSIYSSSILIIEGEEGTSFIECEEIAMISI